MPELRKDPLSNVWVLISPERRKRPHYLDLPVETSFSREHCPFCENNEELAPPEIFALRLPESKANQPGWQVRVIPNKFPAVRVDGNLESSIWGSFERITGVGSHEVVIENPDHDKGLNELEVTHIQDIFLTIKERILDLKGDIRFEFVQVFKNQGPLAGATIPHPHMQIMAMPVVPTAVRGNLKMAETFFEKNQRCFYCHNYRQEKTQEIRLLTENYHFMAFAPFASRFPFQLTIIPKIHNSRFEESVEGMFKDLAEIVKLGLIRINKALNKPSFHLLLHNSPFKMDCKDYFHWHLEIIPVISGTGGFELATGCYINPYPPEEAIEVLKRD